VLKVVGATKPPALGQYTPFWLPLDDDYTERREFETGVDQDQFFLRSGKMETTMKQMKATTYFGKPLVLYKRGSFEQKPMEKYSKPKNKHITDKRTAVISVDLFPKLTGSIDELDEAD